MHDSTLHFYLERESDDTMSDSTLKIQAKVLLIPSILLTKGLIVTHLKLSSNEIKCALDSLCEKQLLTTDKFLQCGKRKIQAYLKFVPENIENRIDIYLLQRRLLDMNVNVHAYIDSLKIIQFATASSRPSNLLLVLFEQEQNSRLQINLALKRKCMSLLQ